MSLFTFTLYKSLSSLIHKLQNGHTAFVPAGGSSVKLLLQQHSVPVIIKCKLIGIKMLIAFLNRSGDWRL